MVDLNVSKNLLTQVQQAVAAHQPELNVTTNKDIITLNGLFVVSGTSGPFDSYQVMIAVTADFPWQAPFVFETGDRIPKVSDRHIYPEYGNCCLGVWEEWLLTAPDHTFETFLTGILHDYFVGQTYFMAKGEWPFGERSHGDAGVLESYADLLGIENDTTIVVGYLRLLTLNEAKGHNSCPCGSGRKLRQCHRDQVDALRKRIPLGIARRMLNRVAPKKSRDAA